MENVEGLSATQDLKLSLLKEIIFEYIQWHKTVIPK